MLCPVLDTFIYFIKMAPERKIGIGRNDLKNEGQCLCGKQEKICVSLK